MPSKNIDIFELPFTMQMLIIGVLCMIIVGAAYFFDFSSFSMRISGAQQQEAVLRQQLESTLKEQATLQDDVSHLPKIKVMLADWQKKLAKPSEMYEVQNQILKLGAANQLQFNLFSPQPPLPNNGYLEVPIKVSILGDYHQIANFLSQVANMQWIVLIQQVTIGKVITEKTTDKVETRLAGELLLEVYYRDAK